MSRSGAVRSLGSSVLVVGALVLVARPASALGAQRQRVEGQPATANVLQIGLGGEYGVKLAGPELNPWGFGLGIGIGYTLPMGVYLGVPFDYFFGTESSDEFSVLQEAKLWQLGFEGGYDLALGSEVVLRFKAGVGFASVTTNSCVGEGDVVSCGTDTSGKPVLGPGLTFLYLGPSFSLTLDARYELVPMDPLAHGLLFSIGFGF